jgi:hypothetical protein
MVINLNRGNWQDVKIAFTHVVKLQYPPHAADIESCDSFDRFVYQLMKETWYNDQWRIEEFLKISKVQFSEFCSWVLSEYCLHEETKDFVEEAIDAHKRIASGKNITKKRGGRIIDYRPGGTSVRVEAQDAIKDTGYSLTGVTSVPYYRCIQSIVCHSCSCKAQYITGFSFRNIDDKDIHGRYTAKFKEFEQEIIQKLVQIIYPEKQS